MPASASNSVSGISTFGVLISAWYWLIPSSTGPSKTTSPFDRTRVRGHSACTMCMAWETNTRVTPSASISFIRTSHFARNARSPTDRTSSTSRTSGRAKMASENPSRMYIPDE
jgi:hypothetical protein